jgi:2-oxoisovalerate dehydrogenase E1 component alpha subunit
MYELMLLARRLDEREVILQRQGKVAFAISGQGQEAVHVGCAWALQPGRDWVFPHYRDMAVMLRMGMTPRQILLGAFGKRDDPSSGGRQMPSHFSYRQANIVSLSSPVIVQVPQASGVGYGLKYLGQQAVVACFFGEGSTSGGDFHEGVNWAGVHRLPVIFVCENNYYAISVPQDLQMAVPNVADRAAGYGVEGVVVDGQDVLEVYSAMKEAVERALAGGGATLLEAKTYRFASHSSDDDDRLYRSREEVEEWHQRDPLRLFENYLVEHDVLDDDVRDQIASRVSAAVDDATDFAERAPDPEPQAVYEHVYA